MDGFWEDDLDLWDTAAGVLLVREAGGFVTDYRGSDRAFERGEYVAASSVDPLQAAKAGRRGASLIGLLAFAAAARSSRRRC